MWQKQNKKTHVAEMSGPLAEDDFIAEDDLWTEKSSTLLV